MRVAMRMLVAFSEAGTATALCRKKVSGVMEEAPTRLAITNWEMADWFCTNMPLYVDPGWRQ